MNCRNSRGRNLRRQTQARVYWLQPQRSQWGCRWSQRQSWFARLPLGCWSGKQGWAGRGGWWCSSPSLKMSSSQSSDSSPFLAGVPSFNGNKDVSARGYAPSYENCWVELLFLFFCCVCDAWSRMFRGKSVCDAGSRMTFHTRWENYFGRWEITLAGGKIILKSGKIILAGQLWKLFFRWKNYFGRWYNYFGRWENYFDKWWQVGKLFLTSGDIILAGGEIQKNYNLIIILFTDSQIQSLDADWSYPGLVISRRSSTINDSMTDPLTKPLNRPYAWHHHWPYDCLHDCPVPSVQLMSGMSSFALMLRCFWCPPNTRNHYLP